IIETSRRETTAEVEGRRIETKRHKTTAEVEGRRIGVCVYTHKLIPFTLFYFQFNSYKTDCVFIYIQMELCTKTLHEWLYSTQDRNLAQAKLWFKQLVSGVGYLHKKDKIHRDLKPLNILFDSHGRLKICDLGLVTDIVLINGQEVDKTRTNIGTPMYMAPEQNFWSYTSKVDIFSLGLILIELCVCMSKDKACEVFLHYQRGLTSDILKGLPDVDLFVSWLTNKEPSERPSCDEILAHEFLA
ncbi:hypothetical protein PRIPAC_85097, partial [Pristionchus pacificus]